MSAPLGQIASAIVVTADPDTTVAHAAELMREHHVGSLVVVDTGAQRGRPVGIVTDRDLVLGVMAKGLDAAVFTVGDVMSTDLVTASTQSDVFDAARLMRNHRVRRLVVIDAEGRVVGLASLEDLFEVLAGEVVALALAMRGARDRERKERAG